MTALHRPRQLNGLPSLTPDQISQINFNDKSSLVVVVRVVSGVIIALISIIVALRIFARKRATGRLFLDDGEPRTRLYIGESCCAKRPGIY